MDFGSWSVVMTSWSRYLENRSRFWCLNFRRIRILGPKNLQKIDKIPNLPINSSNDFDEILVCVFFSLKKKVHRTQISSSFEKKKIIRRNLFCYLIYITPIYFPVVVCPHEFRSPFDLCLSLFCSVPTAMYKCIGRL